MSDRFFIAAAPLHGRAVLSGDEARHLAKVLRARVGDTVVLFDGHGREWTATVARMDRDRIDLHAGPERNEPPTRRPRLTLAVALPKGDRQKWLSRN